MAVAVPAASSWDEPMSLAASTADNSTGISVPGHPS